MSSTLDIIQRNSFDIYTSREICTNINIGAEGQFSTTNPVYKEIFVKLSSIQGNHGHIHYYRGISLRYTLVYMEFFEIDSIQEISEDTVVDSSTKKSEIVFIVRDIFKICSTLFYVDCNILRYILVQCLICYKGRSSQFTIWSSE